MKKNAKNISLIALTLLFTLNAGAVFAATENKTGTSLKTPTQIENKMMEHGPTGPDFEKFKNLTTGQKEAMKQKFEEIRQKIEDALEKGDYEAWRNVMSENAVSKNGVQNPMLEKITAENFPKLVEMHKLMKRVAELQEELGLKGMMKFHGMKFHGMKKNITEKSE